VVLNFLLLLLLKISQHALDLIKMAFNLLEEALSRDHLRVLLESLLILLQSGLEHLNCVLHLLDIHIFVP
jgi:hypothetical protein